MCPMCREWDKKQVSVCPGCSEKWDNVKRLETAVQIAKRKIYFSKMSSFQKISHLAFLSVCVDSVEFPALLNTLFSVKHRIISLSLFIYICIFCFVRVYNLKDSKVYMIQDWNIFLLQSQITKNNPWEARCRKYQVFLLKLNPFYLISVDYQNK